MWTGIAHWQYCIHHPSKIADGCPFPPRSGTRRSSVLLQTASQAAVVTEVLLLLAFETFNSGRYTKDQEISLSISFHWISRGLSWPLPCCAGQISWTPRTGFPQRLGWRWTSETFPRHCFFYGIEKPSPSVETALQGYASEVETSECLGKTIDLVQMGIGRFISDSYCFRNLWKVFCAASVDIPYQCQWLKKIESSFIINRDAIANSSHRSCRGFE